ncbi:hypothetical protein ACU8KH_00028 [Lachancea thermotolerans]
MSTTQSVNYVETSSSGSLNSTFSTNFSTNTGSDKRPTPVIIYHVETSILASLVLTRWTIKFTITYSICYTVLTNSHGFISMQTVYYIETPASAYHDNSTSYWNSPESTLTSMASSGPPLKFRFRFRTEFKFNPWLQHAENNVTGSGTKTSALADFSSLTASGTSIGILTVIITLTGSGTSTSIPTDSIPDFDLGNSLGFSVFSGVPMRISSLSDSGTVFSDSLSPNSGSSSDVPINSGLQTDFDSKFGSRVGSGAPTIIKTLTRSSSGSNASVSPRASAGSDMGLIQAIVLGHKQVPAQG